MIRLNENYQLCSPKEATHVRILEKDEENVTYLGIYEYFYDADPSEETHYIIQDDGIPFYDFECVMECEYLKLIK